MSLINHCDVCALEMARDFRVVGLGQDRTPSRMDGSRMRDYNGGHLESAEVCSVACAVAWVREHWTAIIAVEEGKGRA